MKLSVIITSFKEPITIGKAIEGVLRNNQTLWREMELIVVAPDDQTLNAAQKMANKYKDFGNFVSIKDQAKGKPAALNLAVSKAKGEILVLTDGDVYIGKDAISTLLSHFDNPEIHGVSGHPISIDNRLTQFGYYSHLFCSAADKKRQTGEYVPMSGYLYAIRNSSSLSKLFPLDENIRAEDAYISMWLVSRGLKIVYEPNATVNVMFPKNKEDWIKQKVRSLGGNIQLKQYPELQASSSESENPISSRSIKEDLSMALFPISFAKTGKELWYSILLYPLRLQLWLKIHKQHKNDNYSKGAWERIESSK